MRSIKFRGKRLDNGELVCGYYVFNPGWRKSFIYAGTEEECIIHEVDSNSIGQYTGINDKKDTEIYEGDRILAYDRKWRVFFSEGCFMAKSGRHLRTLRKMYCEVVS